MRLNEAINIIAQTIERESRAYVNMHMVHTYTLWTGEKSGNRKSHSGIICQECRLNKTNVFMLFILIYYSLLQ